MRGSASIQLRVPTRTIPPAPASPSLLRFGTLHVYPARERFLFRGEQETTWGTVDVGRGRARLWVDPADSRDEEAYYALAIATALLLSGQQRALIHGGALVRPGGGAWLLIGDSHAGKSSTIATATAAAWDFLSDDQIIVWPGREGIVAEGLLRRFHLDSGYTDRVVTGRRDRVTPQALKNGCWRRNAPLEGVLFPVVCADEPTRLQRVTQAEALALIIRQSPWLIADRSSATSVLGLFTRIATLPAYRLRLGLDSYNQPAVLGAVLGALQPV